MEPEESQPISAETPQEAPATSTPEAAPSDVPGALPASTTGQSGAEALTQPFQTLDPRVIHAWRVGRLIGMTVQMGVFIVIGLILLFGPKVPFVFVGSFWGLVLILNLIALMWYPSKAWQMWGYRLNDKVLETRRGVWWQTAELLPLSRLQHVDLQRGPVERYFGICSLVLYTAGTENSAIVIPGLELELASAMRDKLAEVGGDDGV